METKTILLIEDNEDDIELARRAFQKLRVSPNVHIVRDGAEALDYIFCPRPDGSPMVPLSLHLILLDLNLPKIPGLEVLRRIRSNPLTSQIPIVVCIGFAR